MKLPKWRFLTPFRSSPALHCCKKFIATRSPGGGGGCWGGLQPGWGLLAGKKVLAGARLIPEPHTLPATPPTHVPNPTQNVSMHKRTDIHTQKKTKKKRKNEKKTRETFKHRCIHTHKPTHTYPPTHRSFTMAQEESSLVYMRSRSSVWIICRGRWWSLQPWGRGQGGNAFPAGPGECTVCRGKRWGVPESGLEGSCWPQARPSDL